MPKRICAKPNVMMGKPVFEGTRIPVEIVLRKLGCGDPIEQILRDYPNLDAGDIRAAQLFAAEYLAGESVVAAE